VAVLIRPRLHQVAIAQRHGLTPGLCPHHKLDVYLRQKMEPNAMVIFFYGGSCRATLILLMMRLILFAFAGRQ
jgi:hypothetical protein